MANSLNVVGDSAGQPFEKPLCQHTLSVLALLVLATKGANLSRGSHVGVRTLAGQAVDWKRNAGRMTFQLRAPATDIMQTMT